MGIPENINLNHLATAFLLLGLFLFITGLKIINIEKISVASGFKTWGLGVLLMISSMAVFTYNLKNSPIEEENIVVDKCNNKAFTVTNINSEVTIKANYHEDFTIRVSWDKSDPYGEGKGDSELLDVMPGEIVKRKSKGRNSVQVWAWNNINGDLIDSCSDHIN